MDNYIKVEKKDVFKLGILDENDKPKLDENGNELYIELDLADMELPLKINQSHFMVKKATNVYKMKVATINKRADKVGKKLLSKNEEDSQVALLEYYKEIEKAIDLFLGENATNKIFGKRRYYEMYDDVVEMINPFMPTIEEKIKELKEKIKIRYSVKSDILK